MASDAFLFWRGWWAIAAAILRRREWGGSGRVQCRCDGLPASRATGCGSSRGARRPGSCTPQARAALRKTSLQFYGPGPDDTLLYAACLNYYYAVIFMTRKNLQVRTTKSFSITVPIHFKEIIDRCAAKQGRTRSGFLTWLIMREQEKDGEKIKLTKAPSDSIP